MGCRRGGRNERRGGEGRRGKLIELLRWNQKWGDKIDFLERIAEEDGVLPKALLTRPELDEHLHFIWSAFHAVASDRPVGLGLAPIPFSAIDRYARRYGVADIDEFERLRRLIGAMDRAVLDDVREDQERERKGAKK